jgi:hypothetical protein
MTPGPEALAAAVEPLVADGNCPNGILTAGRCRYPGMTLARTGAEARIRASGANRGWSFQERAGPAVPGTPLEDTTFVDARVVAVLGASSATTDMNASVMPLSTRASDTIKRSFPARRRMVGLFFVVADSVRFS